MSFDTLAPFYRAMEWLAAGGKLQRCRMAFLGEITEPRRILLAGEGHGRFLPECVARFPEASILVVDSSARMLEIARGKTTSERVTFVRADMLEWEGPAAEFDLIVTHFFLDCFPPQGLATVVAKLGKMATPEAEWLLADFEIPTTPVAGWRSRIIVTLLYCFFRIVCRLKARALVPPEEEITKAGFRLHQRRTYEWGLLKAERWRRGQIIIS